MLLRENKKKTTEKNHKNWIPPRLLFWLKLVVAEKVYQISSSSRRSSNLGAKSFNGSNISKGHFGHFESLRISPDWARRLESSVRMSDSGFGGVNG